MNSAKHGNFLRLIRTKINCFLQEDGFEEEISDDELWRFLQGLQLLRFDLMEEGGADYQNCLAQIKIVLNLTKPNKAREVWNELLRLTGEALPRAGSFRREGLVRKLTRFNSSLGSGDKAERSLGKETNSFDLANRAPANAGATDAALFGTSNDSLSQSIPSVHNDRSSESRRIEEAKLEAKVDVARDFLRKGNPEPARQLLEEVRDWKEFVLSPRLQFRVAANLGSCAMLDGDESLAITEFRAAYRQEKTNPNAMVIGAQGELLDGKAEAALPLCEKALEQEPRLADAALIYIQALHAAGHTEQLAAWLEKEDWVKDNSDCIRALASIEAQEGNVDTAIAQLSDGHKRYPQDREIISQLAAALLDKVHTAWTNDPQFIWKLTQGHREALQRVVNLLKPQSKRKPVDPRQLVPDLSNRAVALMLLDREEEALESLEEALALNPDAAKVWLNLGWLRNKRNETELATEPFEKALEKLTSEDGENSRWEAIRGLAYAYYTNDEWAAIRALLAPVFNWSGGEFKPTEFSEWSPDHLNTLSLWIMATHYLSQESNDQALRDSLKEEEKAALSWLKTRLPDNPHALAARADLAWINRRFTETVKLLRLAIDKASGAHRERLMLGLAESFYQRRRYAAAIPLYKEVVRETEPNIYLAHYAVALLRSRKGTAEAIRIARQIREARPSLKIRRTNAFALLTEIEASTAEYIGDWQRAVELRREPCDLQPSRVDYRIALALMEFDLGDVASARKSLESVNLPDPKTYPHLVMELARASLRIPGALELAYQVWRVSADQADLQSQYVSIFQGLSGEENPFFRPLKIGIENAVTLRSGIEEWTKVIVEAGAPTSLLPNEVSSTHPLARTLLDKSVGEDIVQNNEQFGGNTAAIVEIRHKYVYAFQESIKRFGRGELQHKSLIAGNVDNTEEWLKKQAEVLKSQHDSWQVTAEIGSGSLVGVRSSRDSCEREN